MASSPAPAPTEHQKAIARFEHMARRISANAPEDFGGAMVVVGPDGKMAEFLSLDPSKDTGAFLASAQGKLAALVDEFKALEAAQGAGLYGGMRR